MNPIREVELIRNGSIVRAIAIELLNAALVKVGGEEHQDAWCKALELAHVRFSQMPPAERISYSQNQKEQFLEWLAQNDIPPEEKHKGAA